MAKERLATDILFDLVGHRHMVEHIKGQLAYAHVMVDLYEKALRSQEGIVKKLEEELKDKERL